MEAKLKIGVVGLGKLGFPCAVAMEQVGGHEVRGFDINPSVSKILETRNAPYIEKHFPEFLAKTNLVLADSIEALVSWAEVIFVAVQTPHEELYEGATPVPATKVDFDYSILQCAVSQIAHGLEINPEANPLIVVISTVLPGTMREKVIPLLASRRTQVRFCYNPYFIAMGTTIPDFLNPEFVLVGTLRKEDGKLLENLYGTIHNSPVRQMQIESAELTKVAYNTFIGFKIVFANTISEITSVRGGDVDEVTDALTLATTRLMSGKYLRAGMADGGGCHPRDQIAMSWLADDANLSTDLFGYLARARDSQTERQADLIIAEQKKYNLPITLLGWAYKPDTSLAIGSPARLLGSFLGQKGIDFKVFDPFVFPESSLGHEPNIYFVSTNHKIFNNLNLPKGSRVIDPWGMKDNWGEGVYVLSPGRNKIK